MNVYLPINNKIGTSHALPTKTTVWQWINWFPVLRLVKSLSGNIVKAVTVVTAALTKALGVLEPCAGKPACTVLRGERGVSP